MLETMLAYIADVYFAKTTLAWTPTHACITTTMFVFLQENWTALMAASRNGKTGNVKLLLQYKADPDMQDDVNLAIQHNFKSYLKSTLC